MSANFKQGVLNLRKLWNDFYCHGHPEIVGVYEDLGSVSFDPIGATVEGTDWLISNGLRAVRLNNNYIWMYGEVSLTILGTDATGNLRFKDLSINPAQNSLVGGTIFLENALNGDSIFRPVFTGPAHYMDMYRSVASGVRVPLDIADLGQGGTTKLTFDIRFLVS